MTAVVNRGPAALDSDRVIANANNSTKATPALSGDLLGDGMSAPPRPNVYLANP